MKKDGFTLVELLAVIAIVALITILTVPNVIKLFNSGNDSAMEFQENEMVEAAKLYLQDYYFKPINYSYRVVGEAAFKNLGSDDSKKYICASTVINAGYTKQVTYSGGVSCKGLVIFDKGDNALYEHGKAYFYCDTVYSTKDEDDNDYSSKCE